MSRASASTSTNGTSTTKKRTSTALHRCGLVVGLTCRRDSAFLPSMSWKYTEEYYKSYTRDTWDGSAEAYLRLLMPQLDQWGYPLLADLEPRRGERVLDVATGPGEPAMTIAGAI